MNKVNSIKQRNMNLKSYTDINYNSLPTDNNFSKNVSNKGNLKYQVNDMPKNYEEINDYSFLNVITEEITTLEVIHSSNDLKDILKNSLSDLNSYGIFDANSEKAIDHVISNLNTNFCKAFLHNVDTISYLEIIDQNNDNSYRLQLHHEGYSNLDNKGLDDILTYLIENNNHKG